MADPTSSPAEAAAGSALTDDNRKIWEQSPQHFVDRRVEMILEMLPKLGADASLLDIGCLDGELTRHYADAIGTNKVSGIDVALSERARENGVEVSGVDLNERAPLPHAAAQVRAAASPSRPRRGRISDLDRDLRDLDSDLCGKSTTC